MYPYLLDPVRMRVFNRLASRYWTDPASHFMNPHTHTTYTHKQTHKFTFIIIKYNDRPSLQGAI